MNRRPTTHVAVLEGTKSSPLVAELFVVSTSEQDLVDQLHDLAQAFGNRLVGLDVDRIAIRRADIAKRPSNKEGPRARLLVEGALTLAARERVVDTLLASGRDLAVRSGGDRTKATLDEAAGTLTAESKFVGAVAAAFAILDD